MAPLNDLCDLIIICFNTSKLLSWFILQIVNGRPKQATFVLLHLIGPVAVFAGLLTGLKRYIGGVEKVSMLCGVPLSKEGTLEFFLTQEENHYHGNESSLQDFIFSIFLSSIEKYHFTRESWSE